jgi:hypothetical protein
MNEREIAKKLIGYLNDGAVGLKPGVAYRLQRARERAIAGVPQPEPAPQVVLAGSGNGAWRDRRRHLLADVRVWISILLLVGGALYFQYWRSTQQVRELAETDEAILSSELPIEAYLDRGFQNWLKSSEP